MVQIQKPKQGYKLVKSLFGKYEEIPEEWKVKTFGEVFEFLKTGNNSRSDLTDEGDFHYIHYGDIHTKWKLMLDCDIEKIPCIEKSKIEGLPQLMEGDLIIADASEDHEGSGTSILLKNVKDKKIVSGLHTIALRNIDDSISPNFRTYLTSMRTVKNQIIAYVNGVSVYGLSKNNLKNVKITLPSINEQQKIASILSNVDSLIKQTQNEIKQTQKLKKGLIQNLLTKGIGHTKFKEAKLYPKYLSTKIPEDWRVVSLNDVAQKIADRDHTTPTYVEKGVMIISPTNLDDEMKLDLRHVKYISKDEHEKNYKKTDICPNDIIFSRIGAGLGKSYLVKDDLYNFSILHSLCQIRVNEKILPEFLLWFLRSSLIQKTIWVTVQSIGVPDLGINAIGKLPIFLPSITEQNKISIKLSNTDSQIQKQQEYKSNLENLKKGLMQKLLTGQIRVKI